MICEIIEISKFIWRSTQLEDAKLNVQGRQKYDGSGSAVNIRDNRAQDSQQHHSHDQGQQVNNLKQQKNRQVQQSSTKGIRNTISQILHEDASKQKQNAKVNQQQIPNSQVQSEDKNNKTQPQPMSTSQQQAQKWCTLFSCLRSLCLGLNFSLPIIIIILDQLSDFGYFISKWNQFYSQELRSLTIYFALNQMFSLACFYSVIDFGIYRYKNSSINMKSSVHQSSQPINQGQTKKCDKCFKVMIFFISIVALPFYVLYLCFKIHEIINKLLKYLYEKSLNELPNNNGPIKMNEEEKLRNDEYKSKIQQKKLIKSWRLLYLIVLDSLMQSFPQVIVQSINNNNVDDWDNWALVSLVSSIIVIFYSIIQVSNDALAQTQQSQNTNQPKRVVFQRFLSLIKNDMHFYLIPLFVVSMTVGALISAFAAPSLEYKSAILGIGVSMGIVILGNILLLVFRKEQFRTFCQPYEPIKYQILITILKTIQTSKGTQKGKNQEKVTS